MISLSLKLIIEPLFVFRLTSGYKHGRTAFGATVLLWLRKKPKIKLTAAQANSRTAQVDNDRNI